MGKLLICIDEMLDDGGEVGSDLGRSVRVLLWFCVDLSSEGFWAIGEVRGELSGGGRSFFPDGLFSVQFCFFGLCRSFSEFHGVATILALFFHKYSVIF